MKRVALLSRHVAADAVPMVDSNTEVLPAFPSSPSISKVGSTTFYLPDQFDGSIPVVVDGAGLNAALQHCGTISDLTEEIPPDVEPQHRTGRPCMQRVIFKEADMKVRAYVKDMMRKGGLVVREDAAGNIFGRLEGTDPSLAAVGSGSHMDAIPHSGIYDGCVGVLGAVEAVSALNRAGVRPKRSIDAIMMTSEEPTRFGIGCIGGRTISGSIDAARLAKLVDADGVTFPEAATQAGYGASTPAALLADADISAHGGYSAFVELHVEQGYRLAKSGHTIGVVSAIAAPAALRVSFAGPGGHAGALLMRDRHDAGLAAAELQLVIEEAALRTQAPDTVATAGKVGVFPGAVNSVPQRATLDIDCRDTSIERRDQVVREILDKAAEIAKRRGVECSTEVLSEDPPATSAPRCMRAVTGAAQQLGLDHTELVSRAYHDALFMANAADISMIFIPSLNGGVSHTPEEFSTPQDIQAGCSTLAIALADLAMQ